MIPASPGGIPDWMPFRTVPDACNEDNARQGPPSFGYMCERRTGHEGPHAWDPEDGMPAIYWDRGVAHPEPVLIDYTVDGQASASWLAAFTASAAPALEWRPITDIDLAGLMPAPVVRAPSTDPYVIAARNATRHGVIAYQYEADRHCVECTVNRFRANEDFEVTASSGIIVRDNEGNSITAVFREDEWWDEDNESEQVLECGTCAAELAHHRMHDDEGDEDEGDCRCESCLDAEAWTIEQDEQA